MVRGPLALTPGEPAGIGPDIALAVALTPRPAPLVVVADCQLLEARQRMLGTQVTLVDWTPGAPVSCEAGTLSVSHVPLEHPVTSGQPDPRNAQGTLAALDKAVTGCLDGRFAGLVTGPMQKSVINDAGIPFSGHTEFIAERTGGQAVMMLVAGTVRVALVTTHLPLRSVPAAITSQRVRDILVTLHADLIARFNISEPHIAVLGLNPHAGEGGYLGREEIEIITPVLDALRDTGMLLTGPLPADTAFTPKGLKGIDAVLAMYHDQGLPVLKHIGFGHAVNCTLGLPIIRTSVDHGTALHLAGSGNADSGSLQAAIALAATLTGDRK